MQNMRWDRPIAGPGPILPAGQYSHCQLDRPVSVVVAGQPMHPESPFCVRAYPSSQ